MTQIERARKEKSELEQYLNDVIERKLNSYCKKYNVSISDMSLLHGSYGNNIKSIRITVDYTKEFK